MKKYIGSLDKDIVDVIICKKINEEIEHNDNKKVRFKTGLKYVMLALVSSLAFATFRSLLTEIVLGISLTANAIYQINSYIEDEKEISRLYVEKDEPEKYYRSNFKDMFDTMKNLNQEKVEETKASLFVKVVDEEEITKKQMLTEVRKDIEMYYSVYRLPDNTITMDEYYAIISKTYDFISSLKSENLYEESILKVIKYTFAKSLVYDQQTISYKDIIENLDQIKEVLTFISDSQIEEIQEDIANYKIIPISRKRKIN